MSIYISADIEGVAGVVSPLQTQPGNPEYERARRLMTEEVNAAIEGALEGGATQILVNDAHGPMINLLPELLHPAAELILGKPKPLNMFAGLDATHAGVFCLGYHARASEFGVLAHTTNGFAFRAVRLNGRPLSEAGIYGAYAGSLGVPVVLASGDDRCVAELRQHFPEAEFVEVKQALGNRAARSLPLPAARAALREGALSAVRRIGAIPPFRIDGPYTLELEMGGPALADLAATLPPAERRDAVTVALPASSVADAIRWMNAVSAMSAFLR
jgi:D-amino peptidase